MESLLFPQHAPEDLPDFPDAVEALGSLLTKKYAAEPKEIGARIKQRREELGLSQRQLAFKGCSYAYISRIEAGERRASLTVLIKLSALLLTNVEWLLTGRGSRDKLSYSLLGLLMINDRQHYNEILKAMATVRLAWRRKEREELRLQSGSPEQLEFAA